MAEPFATPDDVGDRWKDLTEAEERRAVVLLDDASRMIRREYPGIDARVGLPIEQGGIEADDLRMVAAGMVKRAMLGPDVEGVTSEAQTVGPFGVTRQFTNPLGNLYLSAADKSTLDARPASTGGPRAFVVDLGPAEPAPRPWW